MFLAVLLLGLNYFVRAHQMSGTEAELITAKSNLDRVKRDQTFILQDGLQDLAFRYSDGMSAVQTVFEAREEIFTGELENDSLLPVVMLYLPDFFKTFQALLHKKAVVANLTIGQGGEIAFLVQTVSYAEAGKQIAVLRFGLEEFTEENKKVKSEKVKEEENEEEEDEEEEEEIPPMLVAFDISNVSRQLNVGGEETPEIFRGEPFVYSFVIQAKINAEYFFYLQELEEERLAELEEAEEE